MATSSYTVVISEFPPRPRTLPGRLHPVAAATGRTHSVGEAEHRPRCGKAPLPSFTADHRSGFAAAQFRSTLLPNLPRATVSGAVECLGWTAPCDRHILTDIVADTLFPASYRRDLPTLQLGYSAFVNC